MMKISIKSIQKHKNDVNEIISQLKKFVESKTKEKLIFTHVGSHSTREKSRHTFNNIDISNLNEILYIDTKNKECLTEPSVPMDKLVNETLKYGLLPEVVMEFPGITVGGAIEGAALESSSYKYGQFNDCCTEYNIITPRCKKIIANRKNNSDLFYGKTGSYGSLGLLTSVKLKLVKAHKYVKLKYIPVNGPSQAINKIYELTKANLDYVEGIVFSKERAIVIVGKRVDYRKHPKKTFSKPSDPWFYKHAENISKKGFEYEELVPIKDYLFRYDRGAYWMGQYFMNYVGGYNILTRSIFDSSLHTREMYKALHLGNLSQSFFIQDFYMPLENAAKFVNYTIDKLEVFPIWLCPMKPTQKPEKLSPHYNKTNLIINVGFYGRSKKFAKDYYKSNRDAEKMLTKLNGRKMLYAHQYFPKNEFWKIYDKKWYDNLRKKYHADKALSDVYERTFVNETYKPQAIRGAIKFYFKMLFGKL